MLTLPPRVRDAACAKARTAAASFRMKTKSVNSNPIWPPNPPPAVAIAEGADQVPSDNRATIRPEPNLPEPRKPALKTVRIARPCLTCQPRSHLVRDFDRTFAFASTDGGIILSGPKDCRGSTKDARILPAFLHSSNDLSALFQGGLLWCTHFA